MPTIKLTEKSVDRIPFSDTEKPVEYNDSKLAGFGVRAGKKSKTYFVRGRANGEEFKRRIGRVGLMPFEAALQMAQSMLNDADQGVTPDAREEKEGAADSVTLNSVLKQYFLTRKTLKGSTKALYKDSLDWYLSDWLELPMRSITPAMVVTRHAEVGQKSKAGADGVFRVVRALYTFAMGVYEEEITRNPVTRLSTLKAWYRVPPKQTSVKPTQLPAFMQAVKSRPGMAADYMTALLFTGIRSKSEIAKLQIEHVDFKEQSIALYDMKTLDYMLVPICNTVAEILRRRVDEAKAYGCPYVFFAYQPQSLRYGKTIPKLTKKGEFQPLRTAHDSVDAIFEGTELAGINPHDMRRSFLSYADEICISDVVQKRLVGHAIPTDITDRYKVLTMARLRMAVDQIEAFILENAAT